MMKYHNENQLKEESSLGPTVPEKAFIVHGRGMLLGNTSYGYIFTHMQKAGKEKKNWKFLRI